MIDYELLKQHIHYHIYINKELLQIHTRHYLHIVLMQLLLLLQTQEARCTLFPPPRRITEIFPIYILSRLLCYFVSFLTGEHG